jgi:hypothetical protein
VCEAVPQPNADGQSFNWVAGLSHNGVALPNSDDRIQQLEDELTATRSERNKYHAELVDIRLSSLEDVKDDHEKRIRLVEEVATKFNLVMALSIGGGSLSAIVLLKTLIGI